jgi:chloramphenicol 3-O-phosphotransferase
MDFIFIHGAPGSGKSTLAWALQHHLQGPCFEFGWIPEFRVKHDTTINWTEEESFSFENLTLVVKNYVRHGFEKIIITDLRDHIIQTIPEVFAGYSYRLVTLWMDNDELLKSRVLEESRSGGYRNWQESLEINRAILARGLMPGEVRFNSEDLNVDQLVARVLGTL